MKSPYAGYSVEQWDEITNKLVDNHPFDTEEIVDIVLKSWRDIMQTKIGGKLQIGVDCFPSPQIMGNFLHELIAVWLSEFHPDMWRKEIDKSDKDVVYIPDDAFSVEIKTSSQNKIYGNRSYGQEDSENNSGKKKCGYYLAVNFEKFSQSNHNPQIKRIKFGWIDHADWKPQSAATGQNSTLDNDAWKHKMRLIYPV